jgi:undecaprenyl-diphosphatase
MAARAVEPHSNQAIALSVALITTALFVVLTFLLFVPRTAMVDRELIVSLRTEASPLLTTFLLAVTFTSGRLAVPAVVLFAAALYRKAGMRGAAYYIGACATAQLLNAILKHAIYRVRPHGVSPLLTAAGGYSYPSADAMLSVVIFGLGTLMLAWSIRSSALRVAMTAASTLFIIMAAIARVYLGAHWPTDVLGGVLAGVACAAFWLAALRRPTGSVPIIPEIQPAPSP